MSPAVIKQMLTELTREGCRVQTLAHDPPTVTFRAPDGALCALQSSSSIYRLARLEVPQVAEARYYSLREAIRAATSS